MLLPEKYESIFDVSSKGPSSGSLVLVYEFSTYTGSCCSTNKLTSFFFYFLQICINSLQVQCASVDSNELDETKTTPSATSLTMSPKDKIDVRSCVQFLMELFEQWVSPYTQPKTPLMLLTQSVKSVGFVYHQRTEGH